MVNQKYPGPLNVTYHQEGDHLLAWYGEPVPVEAITVQVREGLNFRLSPETGEVVGVEAQGFAQAVTVDGEVSHVMVYNLIWGYAREAKEKLLALQAN